MMGRNRAGVVPGKRNGTETPPLSPSVHTVTHPATKSPKQAHHSQEGPSIAPAFVAISSSGPALGP